MCASIVDTFTRSKYIGMRNRIFMKYIVKRVVNLDVLADLNIAESMAKGLEMVKRQHSGGLQYIDIQYSYSW